MVCMWFVCGNFDVFPNCSFVILRIKMFFHDLSDTMFYYSDIPEDRPLSAEAM